MSKVYEVAFELVGKLAGSFNSSFATASSKMSALNTQLAALNKTQNQINAFRGLSQKVKETEAQFNAAQQRVNELAREIRATDNPSKAMIANFEKAKQESGTLKDKLNSQKIELQQLRNSLNAAGVSTTELSKGQSDLRHKIEATKNAQDRLNAAMKMQKQAQQAMSEAKSKVVETAAMGAVAMTPIAAYAKQEDAATGLKVAMMGAGGEVSKNYEKITKLAVDLGNKLPGTTAQFTEMMTMLKRQGMSDEAILGGVGKASAYLAVLLKKNSAEAAEFAAKMQDATQTSEKDMMSLFDTIQRTFYLGVDDNNMLQFFTKISPVMAMVKKQGLEFANMMAPMAVMLDQAGMKGEAAGNAIRKVFQAGFDTKKLEKASKEFGVALRFTDNKGEFGGLENMYKQLEKLKGLSTEKRTMFLKEAFGDDAETQQVLSILMKKGVQGYNKALERMKKQAEIQQRVEAQLNTLQNLWESFTGTIINILASIGQPIAETLMPYFEKISDFVSDTLAPWVEKNKEIVGTVGSLAMAFAGLKIALLGGQFVWASVLATAARAKTVWAFITGQTWLWTAAQLAFKAAMAANPLFWIPVAIAAVVAAGYLLYKNWDDIKLKFQEVWGGIKAWLQTFSFYDSGVKLLQTFADGISAAAQYPIDKFKEVLTKIRQYMPFSDAKVGPLSELTKSGQKVVETFASGIDRAPDIGVNFRNKLTMPNMGGSNGGGFGSITFAPVINISGASGDVRGDIQAGLRAGFDDFESRMKAYKQSERRLSYA